MPNLSPEQMAIVTSQAPRILVAAGAGSGKTHVLVHRAAWLLQCAQVAPEELLLLTFTNKAAQQISERVAQLCPQLGARIWSGTFHSIAHRLLRSVATRLGYRPDYTILPPEEALELWAVARESVLSEHPKIKAEKFPKPEWLAGIYSQSLNTDRSLESVVREKTPSFAPFFEQIEAICTRYLTEKISQNAMDFDDLLVNLRLLLEDEQDLRDALRARFRHVLVDEYQDTNRLQAGLLRRMDPANLFAVGDDYQSIYAFRGAEVRNFTEFYKDFPGAILYRMERSYRCTPEILALAESSIGHNRWQLKKSMYAERESGPRPVLVNPLTAKEQASLIVNFVISLKNQGVPLEKQAVLYRAHHQALELQIELQRRQIPFSLRGGLRFVDQAHVRDLIAYFRVIHNPHDRLAWLRILKLQPGIGARGASAIVAELTNERFEKLYKNKDVSLSVRLLNLNLSARLSQVFEPLKLKLLSYESLKPAELCAAILEGGYEAHLQAAYSDSAERTEDLRRLAEFAAGYESVSSFLDELSLLEAPPEVRTETPQNSEQSSSDSEEDEAEPAGALVLSTVHQAKGLEWSAVYVLSLNQGQFPLRRAMERPEIIEEERRLFYVALTRARDYLLLSAPLFGPNAQGLQLESLFLSELGPNLPRFVDRLERR